MLQDDILTRARTVRIQIIGRLPSARAARAWTAIKSSTECRIAPRIPFASSSEASAAAAAAMAAAAAAAAVAATTTTTRPGRAQRPRAL